MNMTAVEREVIERYSADILVLDNLPLSVQITKIGQEPSEHVKGGSVFTYWVTLTREGQSYGFKYSGSVSDFWYLTGARYEIGKNCDKRKSTRKPSPMLYSVLACIHSDYYCPETFDDFCGDFGYDTDSRKALDLFLVCQKHSSELKRLIKSNEIEAFPS